MIRVLFWLEDLFDNHFPIKPRLDLGAGVRRFLLGVIGYFYPQVFGTGYDTIRDMLNDRLSDRNTSGRFFGEILGLSSSHSDQEPREAFSLLPSSSAAVSERSMRRRGITFSPISSAILPFIPW